MSEDGFLDSVLVETDQFGKYQKLISFFISVAAAMIYFSSIIFVFETKPINHRCKLSGCDEDPIEFKPHWLVDVSPSTDSQISNCKNYKRLNTSNSLSCKSEDFDQNIEMPCEAFVYETSEISIMQDYNLHCEENLWKLTLVGTIHNCGVFVGLPVSGILSDKFGRKTLLIYGMTLSGIWGLLRSFANSYILFMILEFLDAFCISGTYATVWILGVEYVGPKKRVFVTVLIGAFFALGGVIQTLIAWKVQSWRVLLQVLYSLQLIMVFYQWLIPESTRWLLSKQRFTEAKLILENVAKVNGKVISESTLKKLEDHEISRVHYRHIPLAELFSSRTLILRFVNCSTCWVCCIFLYYGFTINSVQLSDNSYLDVILTVAVEIPGSIAYAIADKVGRRFSLSGGFLITGLSCFVSMLIHKDHHWLQITLYLAGKFSVSVSIAVLYTVTTEIFPTPFRNTLLSICSMIGAFGAIAAPQMPLLRTFWNDMPLVLFGTASVLATFLSFLLPETMNIELPNTIEEAEEIGKKRNYRKVVVI